MKQTSHTFLSSVASESTNTIIN